MRRENYLAHYGVLGMRWGVHKSRRSSPKKRKKSRLKKVQNKYHICNKDLLTAAQALGYTVSATGGLVGAVTGHAELTALSNFLGNAVAATGSVYALSNATIKKGVEFVNNNENIPINIPINN